LDVRNAHLPLFFDAASDGSADCFARLGKRGTNDSVTDLSRDVALPQGFPADSE